MRLTMKLYVVHQDLEIKNGKGKFIDLTTENLKKCLENNDKDGKPMDLVGFKEIDNAVLLAKDGCKASNKRQYPIFTVEYTAEKMSNHSVSLTNGKKLKGIVLPAGKFEILEASLKHVNAKKFKDSIVLNKAVEKSAAISYLKSKPAVFAASAGVLSVAYGVTGFGVTLLAKLGIAALPAAGLALTVGVPVVAGLLTAVSIAALVFVGNGVVSTVQDFKRTAKQRYELKVQKGMEQIVSLEKGLDDADKPFIAKLHQFLEKAPSRKFDEKENEVVKKQPKKDKLFVEDFVQQSLAKVVPLKGEARVEKEQELLKQARKLRLAH